MKYIAFPLLMTAAVTAAILHPTWPVFAAATLAFGGIVLVLERLIPWSTTKTSPWTDIAHLFLTNILVGIPSAGLGWAAAHTGLHLWPTTWPLATQLALALLAAELGNYWFHRASHEWSPFLWRLHAVHHSAPRLWSLASFRFHPLEGVLYAFVSLLPLLALGADERLLIVFSVFARCYGMIQHSNIDLRLGPLNTLFGMAEVHRWHHNPTPEKANANYANILPLYDFLFRTRHYPTTAPKEVGVTPPLPESWARQIAGPFRRSLTLPEAQAAETGADGVSKGVD